MNFIESILLNLSIYDFILIITLVVLWHYKWKGYKSLPFFFEFILSITILEVIVQVYWKVNFKTNLFIFTFIAMLSIGYYFYVYYDYFKSKKWSKIIRVAILIWVILSLYLYNFDLYNRTNFEPLPYFFGISVVAILIFKYGYNLVFIDEFREITKDPVLYISLGIILFYVSSFTHMLFINELLTGYTLDQKFSDLITYTNIFISLGYLGAALCSKK